MKRNGLTKLLFVVGMAAGLVIAGFYSCEKQSLTPNMDPADSYKKMDLNQYWPVRRDICGDYTKKRLIRDMNGSTIGEVIIYNDLKYMYVLLHTKENFYIKMAYMHAGANKEDFPSTTEGVLMHNEFKYVIGGLPLANVRRFRVPLRELNGKSYYSVMAEVKQKGFGRIETSWVEGRAFGTEGMIFLYDRNECEIMPGVMNPITENE